MKCPICEIELTMSERQGVEIDYCPKCRGVWLDRGELDKIIEKSTSTNVVGNFQNKEEQFIPKNIDAHHSDHDDEHGIQKGWQNNQSTGHKKKGLLGELFDF